MRGRRRSTKPPRWPNRIAEVRERAGLTQEQLAKKLHMAYQTVGSLERGETRLRVEVMEAAAIVLGCHPFELLAEGRTFSERERKLLELFNKLDPLEQDRLLRVADALAEPASALAGDKNAA